MELKIDRRYKKEAYTIGDFYIDGVWFSSTMEDRDRGLRQDMDLAEIKRLKVYGETAIPAGRYKVLFTYSDKFHDRAWAKPFGGRVPLILDVPGYEGIRIHPLNTARDSLGCIGLGVNNVKGRITSSTEYYEKFVTSYLYPALCKGEDVYITIE